MKCNSENSNKTYFYHTKQSIHAEKRRPQCQAHLILMWLYVQQSFLDCTTWKIKDLMRMFVWIQIVSNDSANIISLSKKDYIKNTGLHYHAYLISWVSYYAPNFFYGILWLKKDLAKRLEWILNSQPFKVQVTPYKTQRY
jgi:hypothetical protein